MRVSPLVGLMLVASSALGQEGPPEPPTVAPAPPVQPPPSLAPAAPPRSADPCDDVPQCRLDRFRRQLAEQRLHQYRLYLASLAEEMDRRALRRLPFRTRYPYEIDFVYMSNLGMPGVLLAYAPGWWVKTELWLGRAKLSQSGYEFNEIDGPAGGTQVRFMPVKFALSPYLAVGWGLFSGSVRTSRFISSNGGGGSGTNHFVTLGAGLELVVPYFHLALGYQYLLSYYGQGFDDAKSSNDQLKQAVVAAVNGGAHGVALEVGCAF